MRLESHAHFVELILAATTFSTGSNLLLLNQGQSTASAFKILIAAFAGAPTTSETLRRLLWQAFENLQGIRWKSH